MPGPSSSTTISTSPLSLRQVIRTVPSGGENERALSIRLLITWPRREVVAGHDEGMRSAALEGEQRDGDAVVALDLVRHRRHGGQQPVQIDRRGFLALQLGVEPAGIGDVGDQPVEPLHVVLDHRQQPRAAVARLGERQRLDRRAQRGQRVLQLVRRRRRRSSRSPRCGCTARWSCRAARRTDARSRRGGG